MGIVYRFKKQKIYETLKFLIYFLKNEEKLDKRF